MDVIKVGRGGGGEEMVKGISQFLFTMPGELYQFGYLIIRERAQMAGQSEFIL